MQKCAKRQKRGSELKYSFCINLTLEPKGRYTEGEVNIHYKSPIQREEKECIPEEELRKRQVQQD